MTKEQMIHQKVQAFVKKGHAMANLHMRRLEEALAKGDINQEGYLLGIAIMQQYSTLLQEHSFLASEINQYNVEKLTGRPVEEQNLAEGNITVH